MASGEQHSPSKGQKISTSSSSSRNESNETQWKLLPNNLELSTRSKPSKKQRNKEKLRSFPPEVSSSSSNVAENFPFNPSAFYNCPRAKCNTASWLKDQMVNEEKSKRRAFESDEVFSDSDLSLPHRVNMNFPVSQTFHAAEQHQSFQRPPSRNVVENENTKSTKDEFKKNEADSAIIFERLSHLQDFMSEATTLCEELDDPAVREQFSKLNEAVKHVADEEREKDVLLSQLVPDNGCYAAAAAVSPSSSTSKASKGKAVQRVTNGSELCGEEEHANKCNHLLEKMKQSEEKLMALKLQESLLHHMRKKAEKFSGAHGRESLQTEDSAFDPLKQSIQDEIIVNGGSHWSADMVSEQRQPLQSSSSDKTEQSFNWKDEPQDMKQLHISLEHIKKRVQSMQQISECKNMTDSVSSDDCDDVTDVGQRVAAVELERKKLKNKLIELQEKKKMNDELLKELCYLKDTVSANAVKNGESFLPPSRNSQLQQSKDKREKIDHNGLDSDRKLMKLQATLQQLEEMMNALSSEARSQDSNLETSDVSSCRLDSRRARSVTSVKRDNVRKEQNSGFPARRHYEAEGRANEDADVPVAQAPILPLGLDKLRDHPDIQDKIDKIRKLHMAQQQVKVINDIMASIQEAKKSGRSIPVEYLHLLSSIEKRDEKNELDDVELDTDSEIDEACSNVAPEGSIAEDTRTNAKEVCAEMRKNVQNENENLEHNPDVSADPDDTGIVNSKQNPLAKLQSHFHQLMQMFPAPEQRKDDPVRSSGEGEYSQNRNSSINIPIASRLTAPPILRQDNIQLTRNASSSMSVASECLTLTPPGGLQDNLQLTRQNIASMESQNQNASANFHHKGCSSLKKDNINNLSGKKGKFCLQKSMAGSYVEIRREPKDNLDSLSAYSTDVSQNRATSNENERKTILDILKSDKKKQKMYDRNKGNQICSNSSIDSEPLEGSNSALAADTTIAATWGGSSTQENFEDENDEQVESLEEQEEDEDSMEVPVLEKKGSVCGHRKVAQFPQQFMQQSVDSVSDNSDKTENFHKKAFIRDPQIFHGYHHHPPPPKTRSRKMASFSGGVAGSSREMPSSASCSDAIPKDNQQHLSSGFVQQLKSHIEQLSALCQTQFLNDKPQVTKSYHQNSSQSIPNMCQPVQAISDMSQPYNQQLLLCLSQCYHALYMQQLEIQHLQRCIRHGMDSELAHQTNNLNSHSSSSEDMAFRPWCMSTWSNPLLPSNLYLGDQASPLSPASYLQLPVKPHPPLNSNVSGTRPVRAVIHPASQDNRAAQETLNNQVPPRTRANNFWDNFRSYSRQNLLSTTTNTKRNENVGLPVAPQIRQVRPMVPNESTNRTLDMPNSYCSASASSQLYRPSHNPELQVILSRSKKPNAAAVGCPVSCSAPDLQKRAVSSNLNTSSARNPRSNRYHIQNTESSPKPPVTYGHSVNLIQLHPSQDDSKVGTSSICPTSAETLVHTASENLNTSNSDQQSDFLIGLYEEAKALKSDAHRQRALNLIRDLVVSERNDPDLTTQNKIRNDQSAVSNKPETNTNAVSVQTTDNSFVEASNYLTESNEAEKPLTRVSSESNVPWSSQNLPTAAIPPLNKHATSQFTSTGAIRKRSKHQSATFEDTLASTQACSYESLESASGWENLEHTSVISNSRLPCDFPGTVVENILVDLQSALPFGQLCLLEDSSSFWAAVTSYIIYRIRVHINIPLSQKALTSLRQALDHALARFTGANFCDCEADFLKCIAEFLYESLSCFVSTGRFTSSSLYSSAPDDDTSALDVDDKIPELPVTMPIDADDKIHELCISMPTEDNDVYSSQFRSVLLQNVINDAGAEGNSNPQVNVQPDGAVGSEDDVRCECHPEAEAEPEVEAGTEADLAEADQSPGQQGAVGVSASIPVTASDNWSLDQAAVVLGRNVNISNVAIVSNNEDVSGTSDDTSEILLGAQFCPDNCVDPVIIFDDIPTKLCPGSEEEPQRQPKEETVNLGRSEDANETGEFSAENICENEQNSLK